MGHARVYATVSPVVQVSHMDWHGHAPPLPWAVYHGEDSPYRADNGQFAVKHSWTVELYERVRDSELEQRLGAAIRDSFGSYRRNETYVESEECLMVSYYFSEIEGEFDG